LTAANSYFSLHPALRAVENESLSIPQMNYSGALCSAAFFIDLVWQQLKHALNN